MCEDLLGMGTQQLKERRSKHNLRVTSDERHERFIRLGHHDFLFNTIILTVTVSLPVLILD